MRLSQKEFSLLNLLKTPLSIPWLLLSRSQWLLGGTRGRPGFPAGNSPGPILAPAASCFSALLVHQGGNTSQSESQHTYFIPIVYLTLPEGMLPAERGVANGTCGILAVLAFCWCNHIF